MLGLATPAFLARLPSPEKSLENKRVDKCETELEQAEKTLIIFLWFLNLWICGQIKVTDRGLK